MRMLNTLVLCDLIEAMEEAESSNEYDFGRFVFNGVSMTDIQILYQVWQHLKRYPESTTEDLVEMGVSRCRQSLLFGSVTQLRQIMGLREQSQDFAWGGRESVNDVRDEELVVVLSLSLRKYGYVLKRISRKGHEFEFENPASKSHLVIDVKRYYLY